MCDDVRIYDFVIFNPISQCSALFDFLSDFPEILQLINVIDKYSWSRVDKDHVSHKVLQAVIK